MTRLTRCHPSDRLVDVAAHLKNLSFFVSWFLKICLCSVIKKSLRFWRARSISPAIPNELASSSLLKNRKFNFSERDKFTKLLWTFEILSRKGFLTDAKQGQTKRKCSSFSIFLKLQILQVLESRSDCVCRPFSSSMSNVPSLKFAIAFRRFLPLTLVKYFEMP